MCVYSNVDAGLTNESHHVMFMSIHNDCAKAPLILPSRTKEVSEAYESPRPTNTYTTLVSHIYARFQHGPPKIETLMFEKRGCSSDENHIYEKRENRWDSNNTRWCTNSSASLHCPSASISLNGRRVKAISSVLFSIVKNICDYYC